MKTNKTIKKVISFILLWCLLISALAACSKTEPTLQGAQDVLTNKATESGKIPLTIMCKFGINFEALEQAAEKKFPNLDLIIVNNYTFNSDVELEARLAADDLSDIVTVLTPAIAQPYYQERMID